MFRGIEDELNGKKNPKKVGVNWVKMWTLFAYANFCEMCTLSQFRMKKRKTSQYWNVQSHLTCYWRNHISIFVSLALKILFVCVSFEFRTFRALMGSFVSRSAKLWSQAWLFFSKLKFIQQTFCANFNMHFRIVKRIHCVCRWLSSV